MPSTAPPTTEDRVGLIVLMQDFKLLIKNRSKTFAGGKAGNRRMIKIIDGFAVCWQDMQSLSCLRLIWYQENVPNVISYVKRLKRPRICEV